MDVREKLVELLTDNLPRSAENLARLHIGNRCHTRRKENEYETD